MSLMLALLLGILSPFAAVPAEAQGTPPGLPRNVQVQVVSEGTALKLIWEAPSSWGTSPAGGYEIDRYQGDSEPGEESSDWRQVTPDRSASDTSFTFADVTYGAKYYFRVRSFSNSGDPQDPKVVGNWVVSSGTPLHTHGPPPGKPTLTALTAAPKAPTATTLSFRITCVQPGLGGVTDFIFYAENTSDSSDTHTWNYSPVPLSCQQSSVSIVVTMTGFPRRTSTTTYNVSARARNILGRKSAWSDSVQATTTAHSMQTLSGQSSNDIPQVKENPKEQPQKDAGPTGKKLPPEPPPEKVDGASGEGDGAPPPSGESPLPEEPLLSPDDGGSPSEEPSDGGGGGTPGGSPSEEPSGGGGGGTPGGSPSGGPSGGGGLGGASEGEDGAPPPNGDSPSPEEPSPQDPEQTDDCADNDRENLVRFYDATDGDGSENGEGWEKKTHWNSSEPLDQWYGVDTDEEDGEVVVSLRLANNGLSGEITEELLLCLSGLKELALWGNEDLSVVEEIPEKFVLAVERAVLRDVAEALSLNAQWFDDYEDPFNFSDWHEGVTTDDDERVTELDFTGEDITGVIPGSVFELKRLTAIETGCEVTLEIEAPERVSVVPDDCPEETPPEDMEEEEPATSGGGGCAVGQGDSSVSGFGLFLVTILVFTVIGRRRARD